MNKHEKEIIWTYRSLWSALWHSVRRRDLELLREWFWEVSWSARDFNIVLYKSSYGTVEPIGICKTQRRAEKIMKAALEYYDVKNELSKNGKCYRFGRAGYFYLESVRFFGRPPHWWGLDDDMRILREQDNA